MASKKRAAQGAGSICKKTRTVKGREYTYWEARYTVGRDTGSGRQIQKSIYGSTQKEVREKLQAAEVAINDHDYFEPTKMTLGEWLDIWADTYLNSVKPRTVDSYKSNIETHIKKKLGAVPLAQLSAIDIQRFYNGLKCKKTGKPLSAKTKKNIHGTLHKALEQAKKLEYIRVNPADKPDLPKVSRPEIQPLDDQQMRDLLTAAEGTTYERVFKVTLFTGMREGEVLGLSWDCIDFTKGTITVKQQIQLVRKSGGKYVIAPTKNGKQRVIVPARYVMDELKKEKRRQAENRIRAGAAWDNPFNLVFTNELGKNYCPQTVYLCFKRVAAAAGVPAARFHDLRHSYAVAALRSGDDIKTVQGNLGHHTAAFTLDVYGHVTEQMKRDSAARMDNFISGIQQKKQA